jgi:2-keto-4-pentenoate hydratase/2-oxohepta-3-ene-1,7-dioic acid hydratase in catechol pathway/regulator of RNase E activity RraA
MYEPLDMRPGKIVAVHISYASRAAQRGRTPAFPSYFLKPASSISASGSAIERPAGTELLAFEGEIALIIGTRARHLSVKQAWAVVSGVTAANDFGVYDLRAADKGSNLRSKGGDGFTPLGPSIIPAAGIDPSAIRLRTWVNSELRQQDTTATLLFPLAEIVADLSQLMTLEPGDVILTGTPAGSSVVVPGDVVEVEVDLPGALGSPSTGKLRSEVVQGTVSLPSFSAPPEVDDLQRAEAWGSVEAAGLGASQSVFELTDDLKARIRGLSTATLSSQLRKRGYNNVSIDGLLPSLPGRRMVGLARTLRLIPNREDLFAAYGGGFNAQKQAFDSLGPDDVLVIEARGERGTGTVGDILAARAAFVGAAGIVTDGGVRDLAAISALSIPTYHAGAHPAVLGRRHVPWDHGITIACGGASVQPGDLIVGDGDGVLVIPPQLVEEVVRDSIEQELEEKFIAENVGAGASVEGLYPMNARWRERFEHWRRDSPQADRVENAASQSVSPNPKGYEQ